MPTLRDLGSMREKDKYPVCKNVSFILNIANDMTQQFDKLTRKKSSFLVRNFALFIFH
jgi:hypothetical protein